MKTKSALLRSIGVLLALLVFVAFPSSPARANCGQCDDVEFGLSYGSGTQLFIELICEYPTGADIYLTTNGNDPIINPDGTPGASTLKVPSGTKLPVPYNTTVHVKAIADKGYCWYQSINITEIYQHNPDL
jgi:hypothetical protein